MELQDLHGVHGLKAIRVAVDMQVPATGEHVKPEAVKEVVRSMQTKTA